MTFQDLYSQLKAAYNESNLNYITTRIIELYRHNNDAAILKLGRKIKEFAELDSSKANRLFSQLILLYHPDKLNYYRNMLEKYHLQKDHEKLSQFTHIFIIQEALNTSIVHNNFDYENLYYSQVQYGLDEDDLSSMGQTDSLENGWDNEVAAVPDDRFIDFLRAFQNQENIDFNINSPDFILEQLVGELDLSDSNIGDLKGVEYCKNITSIDLSRNQIIDISELSELVNLESVYLSNNYISDIFILSNLINLKYIDLSFNDMSDIEPLMDLDKLEYLNVIGNVVPVEQINRMRKRGVVVID
ncbi:MAG: leucine-rich repeat domain-containing protein [Calditrichaceae bacterium]